MNIIEQLATHAHDLQESVGGKHQVEIWAWVDLKAGEPLKIHCRTVIGSTGSELCSGSGETVEAAFVKCVEAWKKLGSPTSPESAELRNIKEQAEKLGYTLTPAAQPEPATV
jgi:hypothetical protein